MLAAALAAALVVGSAAESAVPARTCNGWCPQDQPGHAPFLPTWKPTWDMRRSTQLMACNNSGYHNVAEAARYGVAVYDWSNAKRLWANTRPMNDDERLTAQAEMVIAADPGVTGEQPRVWQYRNTIKALNWIGQVREKLDDPVYSGWFVRFRDYRGPASNHSCATPPALPHPTFRYANILTACGSQTLCRPARSRSAAASITTRGKRPSTLLATVRASPPSAIAAPTHAANVPRPPAPHESQPGIPRPDADACQPAQTSSITAMRPLRSGSSTST